MGYDSILQVTLIFAIYITIVMLICWLFMLRPINRRLAQGHEYPSTFGIRIGGGDMTQKSLRATAVVVGAAVLAVAAITLVHGYLWPYGMAAYAVGLTTAILLIENQDYPIRFRPTTRVLSIANLPVALALALGWADVMGWFMFPFWAFHVLCLVSVSIFAYIVVSKIAEG